MSKNGVSIIEIMIALALLSIAAVSLLGLVNLYLKASILNKEIIKAESLSQETLEAVRNFRDNVAWNNNDPQDKFDGLGVVAVDTAYHPEKSTDSPGKWMLVLGQDSIEWFSRKVVFKNVSRDAASHNIEQTYNPSNHDPDTKKIIVTVSWRNREIETIAILSNWQK